MPKESPAKDISDDNANPTATISQDFTSDSSSDQADESNETKETSAPARKQKKSNTLSKTALRQQRKSAHNAKKGIHFDTDLDDPGVTIIQE
eukprot:8143759-Ditylum_brightwellii.AAC.1